MTKAHFYYARLAQSPESKHIIIRLSARRLRPLGGLVEQAVIPER